MDAKGAGEQGSGRYGRGRGVDAMGAVGGEWTLGEQWEASGC